MKGTVYFRESTSTKSEGKAKKQGTWTYAFSVPTAGGRRRQVSRGGFPTKRACEAALAAALVDHGRGPRHSNEPSKQALADFLQDWLDGKTNLKPSTRSSYQNSVNKIRPFVGDVRLCDLTPQQVTKLYRTLRQRGGFTRKGITKAGGDQRTQSEPLNERSVHKVHTTLTGALGYAARTGLIRVNPMTLIDKDDRPKQTGADRPEMKTWTASESTAFLCAIEGDRYAPIYDLGLNTGMRRGELAGLRWADVHDDFLTVRNTRVPADYVVHEGAPKSRKGRRVDLDPDTVAMLRRWRVRQIEERVALGEAWADTGYVFTNELGQPLHPGTISWHFERLVKVAGVPVIRLHDIRHTHATLGLAAGVPLKVMSERLGHATTQITADLYQHVIPGMGADAATKIARLIRPAVR